MRAARRRGPRGARARGRPVRRRGADRWPGQRASGRTRPGLFTPAARPDWYAGEDEEGWPRGREQGGARDAAAPGRPRRDRLRRHPGVRGMSTRASVPGANRDDAAAAVQARTAAAQVRTPLEERDGADLRDLDRTALFTNRELSWLDFNDRVLQLAEDESLPLLERVKFLAIFVTNLDEFFMIRVAGVHDQVEARIDARGPDGLSPMQTLERIAEKVAALDDRHSREFFERVRPALAENGIRIGSYSD